MTSIARTNGGAATSKRFELPALDFKFTPLTDGTNIPPPLPSPIEETPPPVAAARAETPDTSATSTGTVDEKQEEQQQTSTSMAGTKRPAESPISPVSPTSSARPGSIRRLFSRNLLSQSYAESEAGEPESPGLRRPQSQASFLTDKRPKRSSGWFRRLRGGSNGDSTTDTTGSKRATVGSYEDIVGTRKTSGPPPPMIPELSDLEAKVGLNDGSSLGNDMFKHIK
ncbi:hypothetical protein MCOR25_007051 [Pyricularia grisea]|nr:hypothetical protein MCOR25_007051 [Pyricularia grisea]